MEKHLIEELLNHGFTLKKIKSIIEKTEATHEHNLNETTTANTCGLRTIKCQGCHKTFFEDKFMLNKTNKRYRSCINCVMRARETRAKDKQTDKTQDEDIKHKIISKHDILAICDTEPIEEQIKLLEEKQQVEQQLPVKQPTKPKVKKKKDEPNPMNIYNNIQPNSSIQDYENIEPQLVFYKLF
jgi:DNA-binding transcriptional MerR regulator